MAFEFKIPKVLKNFNLFITGKGFAGRVQEVTLPKLSIKTEEYSAGGMDIPIDLDMGMEKMECQMTLSEYNPDVLKLFGLSQRAPVDAVLKGALSDEESVTPVEIQLQGMWKELDMGSWKAGEKQTLSASLTVRYYKLTVGTEVLVEVDATTFERKILGEDQLAQIRDVLS